MTCPDCERFKLSAAMWRNKAYELGGTPLPWDADKKIEEAIAFDRKLMGASFGQALQHLMYLAAVAEREACAQVCENIDPPLDSSAAGGACASAIRARSAK